MQPNGLRATWLKWISCRDRAVFKHPSSERDVRISVGTGQQFRANGRQQGVHADGDKPWQGGLRVHNPFRPANDLFRHAASR